MNSSKRYIYGFNLVRAGAVLAVVLYHMFPTWVPFGYLGVVTFFALAGYLSMRPLAEADDLALPLKPWPRLKSKWYKLYLPLLPVLIVCSILMIFFFPSFLDKFGIQVRSSILGVNNLQQIISGESYFEGQGYVKPLTHIWALSLEWQFYLLFILLVAPFYRPAHRKFWIGIWTVLSGLSIAALYLTYTPDNINRIYYGFDTRLFTFALGALFALIPKKRLALQQRVRRSFQHVLIFILVVISWILFALPVPLDMPSLLVAYTGLTVCLLHILGHHDGAFESLGKSRLLQWICTRSYLIYLWHYPIVVMVPRLLFNRGISSLLVHLIMVALILVIVKLHHQCMRLVKAFATRHQKKEAQKSPSLKVLIPLALFLAVLVFLPWDTIYRASGGDAFREHEEQLKDNEAAQESEREKLIEKLKEAQSAQTETTPTLPSSPETSPTTETVPSTSTEPLTEPTTPSITEPTTPSAPSTEPSSTEMDITTPTTSETSFIETTTPEPETTAPTPVPTTTTTETDPPTEPTLPVSEETLPPEPLDYSIIIPSYQLKGSSWHDQDMIDHFDLILSYGDQYTLSMDDLMKYRKANVSLIGDSLSSIVGDHFDGYLPNMIVDARGSRGYDQLWSTYESFKNDGILGDILVIALGTNGRVDINEVERVRMDFGDQPIILVTVNVPWPIRMANNNQALKDFANTYDNVYIADWGEASLGHPEFFIEDQIHTTTVGSKAFAHLVARQVINICKTFDEAGKLTFAN